MTNLWEESDAKRGLLQINIDELTKAMEEDVVQWITKHENILNQYNGLNQKLQQAQSENSQQKIKHLKQIEELNQQIHQKEMQWENKLEDLLQEHSDIQQETLTDYNNKVNQMREELKDAYDDQDQKEQEYKNKIEKMSKLYDNQIERLNDGHRAELAEKDAIHK